MTPATTPRISVLGPVAVDTGGERIPVGGKQGAVLAMLALEAGRVVSLDRIIDGVWGEDSPRTVRTGLQVQISQLRKLLGEAGAPDAIVTRSPGYVLDLAPVAIDVTRFTEATTAARQRLAEGDRAGAADLARRALAEWSGDPLAGVGDPPFAGPVATRLADQRLDVVELWADAAIDGGRSDDVIVELEHWVAVHPYRESLWQRLVLALYRRGRQVDALDRLAKLRRILSDDLGVRPNAAIVELESAILDQELPLETAPSPSAPSRLTGPGRRLPAAKELVGRGALVAQVAADVGDHPAVVLVGPGGIGKTSLAVNVAADLADRMPDGAWFVDLSGVSDARLVPAAIGAAFGIHGGEGGLTIDDVIGLLLDAHLVLVLDNCEHVVEAAAAAVDALVSACPHVRVLATSRERLAIGERLVDVPPLADDDALALLDQRARRTGATVSAAEREAALGLVHAVDGLPLGVELLAARLQSLSVADIAAQLDAPRVLQLGGRGANARQRSLHHAIQWSYDLLSPAAQTLLCRLSVFEGGATLDAVLSVCADPGGGIAGEPVALVLDALVGASLVTVDRGERATRYRLLETVKAFGADHLEADERSHVRVRHADEMVAWGRRMREISDGPDPALAFVSLPSEVPNLRAAVRFCIETGDHPRLARLVAAPGVLLLRESGAVHDLDTWVDAALRSPDVAPEDRLEVLLVGAFRSGRPVDVELAWTVEARDLAHRLGDEAAGLFAVFLSADVRLDEATPEVEADLRTCAERFEALGRYRDAGQALNTLANLLTRRHRFDDALALLGPRLPVAHRYGVSEPYLRYHHARTLMLMGDLDGARRGYDDTMAAALRTEVLLTTSYAWFGKALLAELEGDRQTARECLERCVVLDTQTSDRREILGTRIRVLMLCVELGDLVAAREHFDVIATIVRLNPGPRELGYHAYSAGLIAVAEGDLAVGRARLLDALEVFAPTEVTLSVVEALTALARTAEAADAAWLREVAADVGARRRSSVDVAADVLRRLRDA